MIIVVTALIGAAESVAPPRFPNVRHVCVTDRDDVDGWECWPAPRDADPRRAARRAKTSLGEWFPDARATLWIDASFDLTMDPQEIVADAALTDCPIVGFRHPDRDNIRDEAREVIRLGLAPADAVQRQLAFYAKAGFGDLGPLTTTGLLVRFRSPRVWSFNDCWWRQLAMFTLRDQLSVDYSAWRAGAAIGYLPGHYRDNRYAAYNRERHRQGRVAA